jgi:hypothetical protein
MVLNEPAGFFTFKQKQGNETAPKSINRFEAVSFFSLDIETQGTVTVKTLL